MNKDDDVKLVSVSEDQDANKTDRKEIDDDDRKEFPTKVEARTILNINEDEQQLHDDTPNNMDNDDLISQDKSDPEIFSKTTKSLHVKRIKTKLRVGNAKKSIQMTKTKEHNFGKVTPHNVKQSQNSSKLSTIKIVDAHIGEKKLNHFTKHKVSTLKISSQNHQPKSKILSSNNHHNSKSMSTKTGLSKKLKNVPSRSSTTSNKLKKQTKTISKHVVSPAILSGSVKQGLSSLSVRSKRSQGSASGSLRKKAKDPFTILHIAANNEKTPEISILSTDQMIPPSFSGTGKYNLSQRISNVSSRGSKIGKSGSKHEKTQEKRKTLKGMWLKGKRQIVEKLSAKLSRGRRSSKKSIKLTSPVISNSIKSSPRSSNSNSLKSFQMTSNEIKSSSSKLNSGSFQIPQSLRKCTINIDQEELLLPSKDVPQFDASRSRLSVTKTDDAACLPDDDQINTISVPEDKIEPENDVQLLTLYSSSSASVKTIDEVPKTLSLLNSTVQQALRDNNDLNQTPSQNHTINSMVITRSTFRRTDWTNAFENLTLRDGLYGLKLEHLESSSKSLRSVKFSQMSSFKNILTIIQLCPHICRLSFSNVSLIEKKFSEHKPELITMSQLKELEMVQWLHSLSKYEYWLLDFFTRYVKFCVIDSLIFRGRDFFEDGEKKEVYYRRIKGLIDPGVVSQFILKNRTLSRLSLGGIGFQLFSEQGDSQLHDKLQKINNLSSLRIDLNTEGIESLLHQKLKNLACGGFIPAFDNKMKSNLMKCFQKNQDHLISIDIFPCIVANLEVPQYSSLYCFNCEVFQNFTKLETLSINISTAPSNIFTQRYSCGKILNIYKLPPSLVQIELYTLEFNHNELLILGKNLAKFTKLKQIVLSESSDNPFVLSVIWIKGLVNLPNFTRGDFFGSKLEDESVAQTVLSEQSSVHFSLTKSTGRISLVRDETT